MSEQVVDAAALMDALRERGAPRLDALRWCTIEAIARRAQQYDGALRQVLEVRLHALLQDCADACERAAGRSQPSPPNPSNASTAGTDALAALSAHIARHAHAPGSELQTLRWFRQTGSRIRVGQRLKQSLAKDNGLAGPINSHGLVLRALKRMRELSPAYLDRHVAYVDALLALDQAGGGSAMQHRDVVRTPGAPAPAKAPSTKPRASRKRLV